MKKLVSSGEKRMEEFKTGKKMRLMNKRIRPFLIALAVFFVFLWLASAAGPAYAAGGSEPVMWPGGGEGGGTYSYKIEGWVFNPQCVSRPVSGMHVYLSWGYPQGFCPHDYTLTPAVTDSNGHFEFTSSSIQNDNWYGIQSYSQYYISVNGYFDPITQADNLGHACDNPIWCQWLCSVTTDSNGYAMKNIYLDPLTVVRVPAAALFSNSNYSSITYTQQSSHDLSFSCSVAGVGYSSSTSQSVTFFWSVGKGGTAYYSKRYYAAALWDDRIPGVAKAGISGEVEPHELFSGLYTPEYINPTSLPSGAYFWFDLGGDQAITYIYSETSSRTWKASASVSFAISYSAFGVQINLDIKVSATSGFTDGVSFTVDRLAEPPTAPVHRFYVYTPEFSMILDKSKPTSCNNKGGMELHIWDMGVPS